MEVLYSTTVFGFSVYVILWLFLIYSFLGVIIEVIFCLVMDGVLEARLGLLYLPLRPMYGVGGVASELILDRFLHNPLLVFVSGVLICSVVEYVAGFLVERAFGTVSWDYSDKLFNLHGRVCLQYSVCWGVLILLALYVLDPYLDGFVNLFGRRFGEAVLTVLMTLVLLSAVVTLAALARVRERVDVLEARARGEAVSASDTAWSRLIDRVAPDPVMINTFSRMTLMTDLARMSRTSQRLLTRR
jgi:uncharacterized membrane protein